MQGEATIAELCLVGGRPSARIVCDSGAVPGPGRYLLAHDPSSNAPLATELFAHSYFPDGFTAAPSVPRAWLPGSVLNIRGPLGMGFEIPSHATRVGLAAFNQDPSRLMPLAQIAIARGLETALVTAEPLAGLPLQVEVQPPGALSDVCEWADYIAIDVERDAIASLLAVLTEQGRSIIRGEAQVLVRTPMPCGGMAECGVCTVRIRGGEKLACVDGPVFDLGLLDTGR